MAEVTIEYEPMESEAPIIWDERRYDYCFKVNHVNSKSKPWYIYCCEQQIDWVVEAKETGQVLTQGYEFTNEDECHVLAGEFAGTNRGRTILQAGLYLDEEQGNEFEEVVPLESESELMIDRSQVTFRTLKSAEQMAMAVRFIMQEYNLPHDTAYKIVYSTSRD